MTTVRERQQVRQKYISVNHAQTNTDGMLLLLLCENPVSLYTYFLTYLTADNGDDQTLQLWNTAIKWQQDWTNANICFSESQNTHQMGFYFHTWVRSLLGHTFPYLSPEKVDVMTLGRRWHSARWLKCLLTPILLGDEICHTRPLSPYGNISEICRRRWINRAVTTWSKLWHYPLYHLSSARWNKQCASY